MASIKFDRRALDAAIARAGLKDRDIAKQIGYAHATALSKAKDRESMSDRAFFKLCAILDVQPESLMKAAPVGPQTHLEQRIFEAVGRLDANQQEFVLALVLTLGRGASLAEAARTAEVAIQVHQDLSPRR